VASEALLFVIATALLFIEIGESVWAYRLHRSMEGKPGSKFTPIMSGTLIGITAAQGILFSAFLVLALDTEGAYYAHRVIAIIVAQALTAATMLWAIYQIRKI
jgi:hypothetical protein